MMILSELVGHQIFNQIANKTGNTNGTAAIMAALRGVSGLDPTKLQEHGQEWWKMNSSEYTNAVNLREITKSAFYQDGYGYGLAQFSSIRLKKKLWETTVGCDDHRSIGNIDAQMNIILEELEKRHSGIWKRILAGKEEADVLGWAVGIVLGAGVITPESILKVDIPRYAREYAEEGLYV